MPITTVITERKIKTIVNNTAQPTVVTHQNVRKTRERCRLFFGATLCDAQEPGLLSVFGGTMNPATLPLPDGDRGNLEDFSGSTPSSATRFLKNLSPAELERRRAEGRAKAVPQSSYSQATGLHCLECFGVNPAVTDCEGNLCECALYPVNTR
jgi:hypothetical protein